jgi:voltage-gated potassium channel
MSPKLSSQRELKSIGYELFIGALSILSIGNLIALLIFNSNSDIQTVLEIMNAIMFPIFLVDFFYRLSTAESRSGYFFRGFGWADLLSSLPFPNAKILRLFRLWRVYRLFKEFGVSNLLHEFITQRAQNALLTVSFLVLCVLEFGALAVLYAERSSPDANIKSASDAIWWAYVTITTVGYGDRFPVTNWGRIVGIFVMTAGVGLFGTLSGFLANTFLTPSKPRDAGAQTAPDAADPKAKLAAIKRMIEEQEESTAKLKAQLEEIDKLL